MAQHRANSLIDPPSVAPVVFTITSQHGCVFTAGSHFRYRLALRQARELRPDVALVDISLGAESGFDVGRQITPHVKSVILISSRDEDDYAELIADSPGGGLPEQDRAIGDAIRRLLA